MNILVVVSDTLRRDHVPCYGAQHVLAPNMEAFGATAQVFENAYAASFPTVPARADLMTGRYTFTYLDWGPLPGNETTLAQCLARAGYLTMGIADTPFLVRNGYGYDRGFRDFIWIRGQRDGPERMDVTAQWRGEQDRFAAKTFATAMQWLERHYDEQFFLYIDTWDPHEPWDPPAHYVKPYFPDYTGELVHPCYWDWREAGYSERELAIARACYCGEITMVDHWFGVLLDRLRTLDLIANTAILLLSDHGFYFGEHGLFGKRRFRWPGDVPFIEGYRRGFTKGMSYRSPLHNEVARVPLLVYIPETQPQRITGLVSLPDVMPTILELAGAEVPDRVQGRSLLPLVRRETTAVHDVVVTSAPLEQMGRISKAVDDREREVLEISPSSITDGQWDLLYGVADDPVELYRTREDAEHRHNVFAENRVQAEALHAKFKAWLARMGAAPELQVNRQRL